MEINRNTSIAKGEQFLPSIYMFSLGKVKELRESLSISTEHNDDSVVAKYGYTKDFTNMTETLRQKYAFIEKVNLQLLHHEYIDQEQIFKAETDFKSFVDSLQLKLDYEKDDELIVIPQRQEKLVKDHYNLIGTRYVGHNSVLITRIKFLESELERTALLFQNELGRKNSEIEIIKRDMTIEINKKNAEIEINEKNAEIEINKRDSTIEKQKTEMKIMMMEQQIKEQQRIIGKNKQ